MERSKSKLHKTIKSISEDFIPSGPRVEIFSYKEAIIEGCKGILEYGDEYIKLNVGFGSVAFSGNGLYAQSFNGDSIVLRGKIASVEYLVGK